MKITKGLYIFAFIGLALGLISDWLFRHQDLHVVHYVFPTLFAYLFTLAYNGKNIIRLFFSSLIAATILSFPLLPYLFGATPKHMNHIMCFVFIYPLFVYIGHCFHYAYHQDSNFKVSYKSLYAAVWNTFPYIFMATLFVALAQLILILGAFAFHSVGVNFLWDLSFDNLHFRIITNVIFFFVGLSICQQNIEVIYNLRNVIIRAMFYLFPFVALISISYFFFIFSNYITFQQPILNNLKVLIPLVILGLMFFNAYLQDGEDQSVAPPTYNNFVKFYRIIFFGMTIMLGVTVVHEYSFDINVLIYLISVIILGFVYFITIFMPKELECKYIRLGNIYTAAFFMVSLFILNFPYYLLAYTFNKGL